MSLEPEDYVALNQSDTIENPSTVAFIQDNYESLKKRVQKIGIGVAVSLFLVLHLSQICIGFLMIKSCSNDKFAPVYFILAGVIGSGSKISNCVTGRSKRYPMLHYIFYAIYAFEFCWLLVGSYFYLLKVDSGSCTASAHAAEFWLIVASYICVIAGLVMFSWTLSIIFALVYFKNKLVQFLAKSIRF